MMAFWRRKRGLGEKPNSAPNAGSQATFVWNRLRARAIVSRRRERGQFYGERRGEKRGAGIEFADYRPYAEGDDVRHLDLRALELYDKELVRLYREEEDRSIFLFLDSSQSMLSPDAKKFETARALTMSLAQLSLLRLDRVHVITLSGSGMGRHPPVRGKAKTLSVERFLAAVRPGGPSQAERVAEEFVRAERRRGPLVWLSDFFDAGHQRALDALRFHRFEPLLIQVVDECDRSTSLQGALELFDAESGETASLRVTGAVRKALEEAAREHDAELCRYARSRRIPYARIDVKADQGRAAEEVLRRARIIG